MQVFMDGIQQFLAGNFQNGIFLINRAEGVKRSRSAFMKDQKKQKMCERWWNAHKDGKGIIIVKEYTG